MLVKDAIKALQRLNPNAVLVVSGLDFDGPSEGAIVEDFDQWVNFHDGEKIIDHEAETYACVNFDRFGGSNSNV